VTGIVEIERPTTFSGNVETAYDGPKKIKILEVSSLTFNDVILTKWCFFVLNALMQIKILFKNVIQYNSLSLH